MSNPRVLWMVLALLLAVGAPVARAHDGPHKGGSLQGTVVSVAGEQLTVKTDKAEVQVTLGAKTQVRAGAKEVGRAALQPGVSVDVHGSKLPGGGFAAREVVIEGAGEKPAAPPVGH